MVIINDGIEILLSFCTAIRNMTNRFFIRKTMALYLSCSLKWLNVFPDKIMMSQQTWFFRSQFLDTAGSNIPGTVGRKTRRRRKAQETAHKYKSHFELSTPTNDFSVTNWNIYIVFIILLLVIVLSRENK